MVEEVPPVRIVIAEDQAAVREGLALLVGTVAGITVVGQAPDGEVAVRLAGELRPDVVLMDLSMPRCDGVEATRRIKERHPEIEVVVLTTYADDDWVLRALEAGALGYLTKSANKHEIGRAVHAAAAGQALLDPQVQRRVLGAALTPAPASAPPPEDDAKLTKREAHVLTLIAAGRSNKEIAAELFVSETTVKSHINRIFAKTGSRDRAQAVRYAYQAGYVRD
ncbi:DNA-binding response regulator [Amycolatopsis sp. WAC 04169]|uniref:response regulator transcription factor n=1 Tax=Amycolatopsis sp. WAC 04169 TaxID=2203197 RepID=UPI000F7887FB|nr:response regulator transcription factor [Amycolatopsis sp. WAC 04169]RSN32724.1 DNA-binding response regulator [Amycolatopsis sp. WAC 04169]